jgi:hypothetical protein
MVGINFTDSMVVVILISLGVFLGKVIYDIFNGILKGIKEFVKEKK